MNSVSFQKERNFPETLKMEWLFRPIEVTKVKNERIKIENKPIGCIHIHKPREKFPEKLNNIFHLKQVSARKTYTFDNDNNNNEFDVSLYIHFHKSFLVIQLSSSLFVSFVCHIWKQTKKIKSINLYSLSVYFIYRSSFRKFLLRYHYYHCVKPEKRFFFLHRFFD